MEQDLHSERCNSVVSLFNLCAFHCSKHMMYIFTWCILIMDLASGLCHYCTMGLPLQKLFYLYIPIGCLDSSLLLRTEWDCCQRRSFRSACEFCSVWTNGTSGQDNDIEAAGYLLCGNPFLWALCAMAGVLSSTCVQGGYVLYIYIWRLTTFQTLFIGQKGNRRISRMRQSMHFFSHQKYTFWRDISSSVFYVSAQFLGL